MDVHESIILFYLVNAGSLAARKWDTTHHFAKASIPSFVAAQIELKDIKLNEISQEQKTKTYIFTYMWKLNKWTHKS